MKSPIEDSSAGASQSKDLIDPIAKIAGILFVVFVEVFAGREWCVLVSHGVYVSKQAIHTVFPVLFRRL